MCEGIKNNVKTEKPKYTEIGGGQIGLFWPLCWQATFPFARIKIFKDRIMLSVWPFTKTINLKEIASYSRLNLLLGEGIQIKLKSNNLHYLVFWAFNADNITNCLQKLKIKPTKPSFSFLLIRFVSILSLIIIALFIIVILTILFRQ